MYLVDEIKQLFEDLSIDDDELYRQLRNANINPDEIDNEEYDRYVEFAEKHNQKMNDEIKYFVRNKYQNDTERIMEQAGEIRAICSEYAWDKDDDGIIYKLDALMEFDDDEIERFSTKFINNLIDLIIKAVKEMSGDWERKISDSGSDLMLYISY